MSGYQSSCQGSTFRGTFGAAAEVLQADARVSLFFNNCDFPNHPPIEELGNRFGEFLRQLRYEGGEAVSQVDVVAHSLGGLIVRSYLSGKQPQAGVFTPPLETRIRKAVFLGTPHFGSALADSSGLFGPGNAQTAQLRPGNPFLFELATWNQGTDDLRGVDAISVVGNASNGLLMQAGIGDAVTTMISGSLRFLGPNRTRIVPYCHTSVAGLLCRAGTANLADISSAEHLTARIISSFLNDSAEWQTIGQSAEQDPRLSTLGGVLLRYRDASDRLQQVQRAMGLGNLSFSTEWQLLFGEALPAGQTLPVSLTLADGTASLSVPLVAGTVRALTVKPGPFIESVFPSPAAVFPRVVAPGALISIYGSELTANSGETQVTVAGQSMPVSYSDPKQINTLIPENVSGLAKVQVRNAAGEHTVNVLVEPSSPGLFAPALHATTGTLVSPDNPLRPGEFVSLFLTGLGQTQETGGLSWAVVQPEVWVGGQTCLVSYAGRAPGYTGLDQINCRIAENALLGEASQVLVRSRNRFSNTTTLPLR